MTLQLKFIENHEFILDFRQTQIGLLCADGRILGDFQSIYDFFSSLDYLDQRNETSKFLWVVVPPKFHNICHKSLYLLDNVHCVHDNCEIPSDIIENLCIFQVIQPNNPYYKISYLLCLRCFILSPNLYNKSDYFVKKDASLFFPDFVGIRHDKTSYQSVLIFMFIPYQFPEGPKKLFMHMDGATSASEVVPQWGRLTPLKLEYSSLNQ